MSERPPRHPKNRTRFRSLDRIAADPRVEEIWDEGPDGIWILLAEGLWRPYPYELSCFHEWSVRDLLRSWMEDQASICPVDPDREQHLVPRK